MGAQGHMHARVINIAQGRAAAMESPARTTQRKSLVSAPPPPSPQLPPRPEALPVTGLPLDVLREVQEGLGTNLWMLALPAC